MLSRIADPGGIVVIEDLHWADPDTIAVVEYLASNLPGVRVLCLVTVRSQTPSAALSLARRQRGLHGGTHLSLERLNAEQAALMVLACDPDAGRDQVARVQRAAEGVPLLIEEVLASPGVPDSFADTVRERLGVVHGAGTSREGQTRRRSSAGPLTGVCSRR